MKDVNVGTDLSVPQSGTRRFISWDDYVAYAEVMLDSYTIAYGMGESNA
ncbi:MAG: hypothetical protein U9Q76_10370 [candidate division WOR-3 bacterium]|nr:hypothetical protein [candidate division WOR-3 bacterium]